MTLTSIEQIASDATPTNTHDGFGHVDSDAGIFPLRLLDLDTAITGLAYRSTLRQVFHNSYDQALEATYIFPLPPRAGVVACRLQVGDRVIHAELKERGQARAEYQQAIAAGHRAAIAEEDRPEVFSLRVGNVMPGEDVAVELETVGALSWDENEAGFRFPLVVAPRYMPGRALPSEQVGAGTALDTDLVPDASRISPPVLLPGYANPIRLGIRISLDDAGLNFHSAKSSLPCHSSEVDGRSVITLDPGAKPDRDFILRFAVGESQSVTASARATEAIDGNGTIALTIVPPLATSEPQPRDVVILLDRSGSMDGWKMTTARRAAARLVDSLDSNDRVQVLAFDDRIDSLAAQGKTLEPATDRARFATTEFLAKIDARGGTEIAEPLKRALGAFDGQHGRQRAVVLITDGQVGNEDHLLRLARKQLGDTRIFTVGIDRAVNAGFLERLAELGNGFCELVESEDRLDEVLDRVRRRLGQPAFQNAQLSATGITIDPESIAPRRLSDAFPGRPWTVYARYSGSLAGASITVDARDADGKAVQHTVPVSASQDHITDAVWARGHLRDLEDRYVAMTEDRNDLEARILAVSLQHKVLCRFTAWLAVDHAEVVNEGGENKQVTQAVHAPSGWEMFAEGSSSYGKRRSGGGMASKCMAAGGFAEEELDMLVGGEGADAMDLGDLDIPAPSAAPGRRGSCGRSLGARRSRRIVTPSSGKLKAVEKKQDANADHSLRERWNRSRLRGRAGRLIRDLRSSDAGQIIATVSAQLEQITALVDDCSKLYQVDRLRELLTEMHSIIAGKDADELRAHVEEFCQALCELLGIPLEPSHPGADGNKAFWK